MTAPAPSGSRSALVLLTVPPTMVHDDEVTIRRKLAHPANVASLLDVIAHEMHRCLHEPDASPELLLARVVAESKAQARGEAPR